MIDRQQVLAWLTVNVSAHRLEHILGVEQMCGQLAKRYQIEQQKAEIAGLLHDLAKFHSPSQLLSIAETAGIEIDEICLKNPHLLHADVSAVLAKEEFGVEDAEILNAISNHTLGSPQMSPLSCIVFVADALEINRGDSPELEAMRQLSGQNLYQTLQQTCDFSLKYLIKKHCTIHPRTVLTRNWALTMLKEAGVERQEAGGGIHGCPP